MLIVITLLPSMVLPAMGATNVVTVDQKYVTMNMRLQLIENFTTLPLLNVTLNNSASLVNPVQTAIQKKVPTASINLLQLRAKTTLLNPSQNLWLLQENYTMVIAGANMNTGSRVASNLSFLSMNVSDSIYVSNFELNTVGSYFLLQALKTIPATPFTGYFLDGATFRNSVIPGINTQNFRFLDFTWIPPVSQWSRQGDILKQSTRWDLNPSTSNLFQEGFPYNLTVGLAKRENTYTPVLVAIFDPSLEISVSANAWVSGTTLYFSLPSPLEAVMAIIVTSALMIAVIAFLFDRRITQRVDSKRRKRG
jgi:hypothetical protein